MMADQNGQIAELQEQMTRIEQMLGQLLERQGVPPVAADPVPKITSYRARCQAAIAETEARELRKKKN